MLKTEKGKEISFIIGVILYMGVLYSETLKLYAKSRMMPQLILGILAVTIISKLGAMKFGGKKTKSEDKGHSVSASDILDAAKVKEEIVDLESIASVDSKRDFIFMLWLIAIIPITYLFGFFIGFAIWLFSILLTTSKIKLHTTLITTVITFVIIYVGFIKLLDVKFTSGILF